MFDKLPIEAIRQIAEYVHLEHPPSLSSLALTNKLCHEVAKTWHWRIIHLNIVSREELRRDVSRWLAVLQQSRSLKHVRRLELRGDMPAKLEDEPSVDSPESPLSNDDWHGTDEIFGIEEDGGFARDASIEILPEEDEAWTPVVQLLQTIPHLADLVFSCHNQFPPSLFKALIDSQPHCRLHLPKFRFRSLRENITNEHEMRVATSPQLSSIGVCYVKRDSLANEDYNEEAVMQLIGGLAPNLRKVRMKHCTAASSPQLYRAAMNKTPRKPWGGFSNGTWSNKTGQDTLSPASLESLVLKGYGRITPDTLINWQKHISFSTLRQLDLAADISGEAMQWAAFNAVFPKLTDLMLNAACNNWHKDSPDFGLSVVSFLNSLLPLTVLELSGSIDSDIFDCIVDRHGMNLRKLTLPPYWSMYSRAPRNRPLVFNGKNVLQLQQLFPVLEDLTMPVKRYKGGLQEVEMYKVLGQMDQLTRIFLTLDCSNPSVMLDGDETPNDPSFDKTMQEFWELGSQRCPRRGHVRDSLINSAVDDILARSIWTTITANKAGRRLKSLKIYTHGGGNFGGSSYRSDLMDMVQHLGRSYLIERSPRDDDDDGVVLKELGQRARVARDEKARENHRAFEKKWGDRKHNDTPSRDSVMEIFRTIWPPKEGSQDWRDDWTSLPLVS